MSDLCRNRDCLPDGKDLRELTSPNASLRERLTEQEKRIEEVRTLLVDLESEHQTLKEELNYNSDSLLLRMPPEIAAEIFKLCIPEEIMDLPLQRVWPPYMIGAPFVLSAVCRRWRNLVHSTPELWNTIPICFRSSESRLLDRLTLIADWLERSRRLPLSINLCVTEHAKELAVLPVPLTNLFNNHSHRWVKLQYDGPLHLAANFLGDIPRLHTLHLFSPGRFWGEPEVAFRLNAPKLHTMMLVGHVFSRIQLDWHTVRKVEMELATLTECIKLLNQAPHLAHCVLGPLRREADFDAFPPHPIRIVLPAMDHLVMCAPLHEGILSRVMMPSLKTLVLDYTGGHFDLPLLLDFLRESNCSLDTLSLSYVNLSESDIVAVCEKVPTLKSLYLKLEDASSPKGILACLAELSTVDGKSEPRYLPHLTWLNLAYDAFDDWNMLPDIFAASPSDTEHQREHCRPALQTIIMTVFPQATMDDKVLVYKIGEETLMRILRLREAGVKWKIWFGQNRIDMLRLAIEGYGIPYVYE
ncbi:hypothetical protein BJ912DRAFT_1040622 [Pholiota molesta]|nr:hypothetical protein BJ912DRAFT_1040622 [Pholiota molesta]